MKKTLLQSYGQYNPIVLRKKIRYSFIYIHERQNINGYLWMCSYVYDYVQI